MFRRDYVFLWTAPLIAAQWLLLVVIDPDIGSGLIEKLSIGLFLGTMMGQTTLAAAWTALGPGPLVWRLPFSLVWVFLLSIAIAFNIGLHGGPPADAAVIIGLCLLGQWLLLQFPLWGLAIGYGLHLQHVDDDLHALDPRGRQFGIGQLIIVTAVIGVALGIGRLLVSALGNQIDLVNHETPIFIFLGVAAVVVSLPLMLAMLMRQLSVKALAVATIFIAVVTAFELPLLKLFHGGGGPETGDFIAINAFTSAVMLVVLVVVRRCGYSLARTSLQQDRSY